MIPAAPFTSRSSESMAVRARRAPSCDVMRVLRALLHILAEPLGVHPLSGEGVRAVRQLVLPLRHQSHLRGLVAILRVPVDHARAARLESVTHSRSDSLTRSEGRAARARWAAGHTHPKPQMRILTLSMVRSHAGSSQHLICLHQPSRARTVDRWLFSQSAPTHSLRGHAGHRRRGAVTIQRTRTAGPLTPRAARHQ